MKKVLFSNLYRLSSLLLLAALCLASCNSAVLSTSSGGMRAWLDQPLNGSTLPLAPFTLRLHASHKGGGIVSVGFRVNDIVMGETPVDSTQDPVSIDYEWNPSVNGEYVIMAIARDASGNEVQSEAAQVCVGKDAQTTCRGRVTPVGEVSVTPLAFDPGIKVKADVSSIKVGVTCTKKVEINFSGDVTDLAGVLEVDIRGVLHNSHGESHEILFAMTAVGSGSYTGKYTLTTDDINFFGGEAGTIDFNMALLSESKEFFRSSANQTIAVSPCSTQASGVTKVGGIPNPVYYGKCPASQPTVVNFEAGTEVDPALFSRVDLAYVWFDSSDTWVGTPMGTENRVAMKAQGGGYVYQLDMNSGPAEMALGGTLKYRAILVNAMGVDVDYTDVREIQVLSCAAGVAEPPTITPTRAPVIIITTAVPPAPIVPPVIITTEAPPAPKPGAIAGMVYYDANGDGKCDTPWNFGGMTVDGAGSNVPVNKDGSFYIGNVDPGTYKVVLNHPGYNALTPDVVDVTVESGGTGNAEFCLASPG